MRYWDPSGHTVEAFIGVHEVVWNNYHTSIIIFVDEESRYWDHEHFTQNYDEERDMRYITIGAGPDNIVKVFTNPNLVSDINRAKDIDLTTKVEMLSIEMDDDKIEELLNLNKTFQDNTRIKPIEYNFFPNALSNAYNSNSFVRGTLEAAGYENIPVPEHRVPGYSRSVPSKYFSEGTVKSLLSAIKSLFSKE